MRPTTVKYPGWFRLTHLPFIFSYLLIEKRVHVTVDFMPIHVHVILERTKQSLKQTNRGSQSTESP